MGMEITEICMDNEPDSLVTYSSGSSGETNYTTINSHHVVEKCEIVNGVIQSNDEENSEVNEYEVKECTSEKPVEITAVRQIENFKQDVPVPKCKIRAPEELKSESLEVKDDRKKSKASVKPKTKSASGNCKTKCTVPQPFALATAKRASFGARPLGTETDNGLATKNSKISTSKRLNGAKQNQPVSPVVQRKPLQPNNKKHPGEEDSCSVASSLASTRKSKTTVASAPMFRCTERAERRKEFYSKLEEKHQALEAEKIQWEERTKEEKEAAIKQFRKSLSFKASPMPGFYHEGPPPKAELKKQAPTRAKSPKLGRRKSCSEAVGMEKGITGLNIYRDGATIFSTNRKYVNIQTGTTTYKSKDEYEP